MEITEARELINKIYLLSNKEKNSFLEKFNKGDSQIKKVIQNYKEHEDISFFFADLQKYGLLFPEPDKLDVKIK